MSNLDLINAMQVEYKLLMTEIHGMKESAQYFTCRGYATINKRLCDAIALAEEAANYKRLQIIEEICIAEQESHVDTVTIRFDNNRWEYIIDKDSK